MFPEALVSTVSSGHTGPMTDWVDDGSTSRDEKLAKFHSLGPEPTVGPLPAGGQIVGAGATGTFGSVTITRDVATGVQGRIEPLPIA